MIGVLNVLSDNVRESYDMRILIYNRQDNLRKVKAKLPVVYSDRILISIKI